MKFYSIFDDFGELPVKILHDSGIEITVHPHGVPRPDNVQMKEIFEIYDGVIIGTSQKMYEEMFENIVTPKVIATASVGLDHIRIPESKKKFVKVLNTPRANAQSVAEFTFGCALSCCKRLIEGKCLYKEGKSNKSLSQKPEDLSGRTLGVIGAGNVSERIMEFGLFMEMDILCWTAHPEAHSDIAKKGIKFVELDELLAGADVISVNLPNNAGTRNIISEKRVRLVKRDAIFISVSRKDTIDYNALFSKARKNPSFYVCLDLDVSREVVEGIPDIQNVIVTPHIAGGTVETRKRMFLELAEQIMDLYVAANE